MALEDRTVFSKLNLPGFIFTAVDSPICVAPNSSQSCVATDVQNVVTPEIGRWLGLASVSRADSTLYPSSAPGDLSKRRIDPGTASGFCAIYPAGKPATMCDGGFVPAKPLDTRLLVSDGGTLRDGGTTDADGGVTGVKQPIPCGCSSAGLGDWGALFAAMYVLRRFAARRLH